MADTDIEWATKVWNFVRGCRRKSPGCESCYAERQAHRFSHPGGPYEGLTVLGKNGPRWTGVGRFVAEKLFEPLSWKRPKDGSRHRVFVNSMSDLFWEEFTNEQIAAGFGVMAACPEHDFLILTKRAERMVEWFKWAERQRGGALSTSCMAALDVEREHHPLGDGGLLHVKRCADPEGPWPLPNVWLGVSAEDQRRAEERLPLLLSCPAVVHWVSAEPLLSPIDFSSIGNALFDRRAAVRRVMAGPSALNAEQADDVIAHPHDLPAAGLRHRKLHDARRTLLSALKNAGVDNDIRRKITHHSVEDRVLDGYTIVEWKTLCEAMLQVDWQLPAPGAAAAHPGGKVVKIR